MAQFLLTIVINLLPKNFSVIWKVGLYTDIAKQENYSSDIAHQFKHDHISKAELVIERSRKQVKHQSYVVRDYYQI